jgi:hypothetical protein
MQVLMSIWIENIEPNPSNEYGLLHEIIYNIDVQHGAFDCFFWGSK